MPRWRWMAVSENSFPRKARMLTISSSAKSYEDKRKVLCVLARGCGMQDIIKKDEKKPTMKISYAAVSKTR
eukprot:9823759-Ditylum_brightwellii.AAC.1